MAYLVDENGVTCFVDQNGVTCFVDQNGNTLCCDVTVAGDSSRGRVFASFQEIPVRQFRQLG